MDYQQAIKEVKHQTLQGVYCLQGSEDFLRQEFRQSLAEAVEKAAGELDVVSFDLNEDSIDAVLDEAETYSFFVDQRLIIADQCDFLVSQPTQKLTDMQQERLLDYLKNPNPASHILFIVPHDGVDKRRKLTKQFQKLAVYVNVSPLDEGAVGTYLNKYLQEMQLDLNRAGQEALLQRVDYQLSQAVAEVQKLKQYAQGGHPLTLEVVENLVTRSLASNVFDLTNAIVARKMEESVQIYQDLILMKNDPIQLHALLVSQFRLYLQVKILVNQGLMQDEIGRSLGVHPYRVKLAMQASRRMNLKELSALYGQFIEADRQMKTGSSMKETAFYIILTKIMQL